MDMAVGVIVGGAFKSIADSLVNDIIMPMISLVTGKISFSEMTWVVGDNLTVIPYGNFLAAILNFLITAFAVFCLVKAINRFHKKKEEAPAAPPAPNKEEALLTEIRSPQGTAKMMEALLRDGLAQLGLSTDAIPSLLRYAALLEEKNKVMNLTAITAPDEVARLHFLDSAALMKLLDFRGKTVVDVGSGAGFPGLPIRILEPSARVTLLDALGKRITFLQEVCDDLGLLDVTCVHARAEEFAAGHRESFDVAVSRAVASLPLLAELCLPLVKTGGTFVAMKSVDSGEELDAAAKAIEILGGRVTDVRDYAIPGTAVTHRAALIEKTRPTPPKYPRPFTKIKKAPL